MHMLKMSLYSNHYKSLLTLGLPIIVGQIGTIILGTADTLMIGHHSTQELAAAAFVNNLFILVLIFSMGFSYGFTPIVGSLFGQGQNQKIGEFLKNSLVANTLLAIILTVLLSVIYLNIGRLGQPQELLPLMRPYFIVNLASIPFVAWFNTFKQLSDGTGDTKTPMWILLSGNLLNILGNYILIYGKMGLPELGLLGAGIATMISRILMAIAFFYLFFCTNKHLEIRKGYYRGSLNRKDFTLLNKLGWPLALQMGMETAAFSLSSVMVGWIGTTALAAHQIILTISQFFYMVYYGMAAAVAVRSSHFHGQQDYQNIQHTVTAGFHLILGMAVMISIPVLIYRNSLGGWFTDTPEVTALVSQVIIMLFVYQFGDGMQCNYSNALRGISDVKPLTIVAFIAYFVISLPTGYLLGIHYQYGLLGIWAAFPIGLTTAGILYYYFFKRRLAAYTKEATRG
uniref:Multidrug-efflux transporter n=1 Tax=Prevotella sp. GTC17254 TaxID=3236794 RepID=A0AB33IUI5_9BACT